MEFSFPWEYNVSGSWIVKIKIVYRNGMIHRTTMRWQAENNLIINNNIMCNRRVRHFGSLCKYNGQNSERPFGPNIEADTARIPCGNLNDNKKTNIWAQLRHSIVGFVF